MQELQRAIEKGESERIEFKESLSLKSEIGETVSAFSNTNKGKIIIGISDYGKIIGIEVGKKTLEGLANYIKQNTDNHIYPKIIVESIDDKNLIIIEVNEANEKPVFFRGNAYRRISKSNHKLSASEIRKLAKESQKIYWDEQVCERAGLDDIDWNFVEEKFIPLYERSSEKKVVSKAENLLKSLGCIKNHKPTNAGILLFGKNPQRFLRNAYIALARYKGKEVSVERLDYKEFTYNLFEQIDRCNDYIVEHMAIMSKLEPGKIRREDIPEYGFFSIRELITNAICHRDYENQHSKVIVKMFSDKIEFYNPGGLPKDITAKNITEKQFSRNAVIAKVLAKVEYIEELGEGWDKIVKEHKEHALKPDVPVIKADKFTTLISLFSTKDKFGEEKIKIALSERQRFILKKIKDEGYIKSSDLQKEFEITRDTANRDFNSLISLKLVRREGVGKSTIYVRY